MSLFAHYDVSGNIRSLTWFNAPKGISLLLTPRPGETVAEVEGQSLGSSNPTDKILRDIARSHVITQPISHCTLKKKA
jgi:hypothetical protein